jgi:diguanylate cyclase (GGDEF)-like protein
MLQEIKRLQDDFYYPVGIIVCDLDGLKLINDTLGHEAGDQLLIKTTEIISKSIRLKDTYARIGGDEFMILLPNSTEPVVESMTRQIRENISAYNSKHPEIPLSISLGYSFSNDTSVLVSDILKTADNNMYREKLFHSQSAKSTIVQTLMKALEARDFITEGHADRLQYLVADIANSIELSESRRNDLRLLAQFHDIGKVGIPDHILFKPGPLNADEKKTMERHCEIGHRIALSSPELSPVAEWILKHHEWWNGEGYPLKLKGNEIPLECRILSIADAYDAMISDRPYRKGMSHHDAVSELIKFAGIQFDPELAVTFINIIKPAGHQA